MNNPWDEIATPKHDVNARRIDHEHQLDLFWAKDQINRYLFIFQFKSFLKEKSLEKIKINGFEIHILENRHESNRLIIILKDKNDWEIFLNICNDLITTTKKSKDINEALHIVNRRLSRWQLFLKNEKDKLLTEEKIKGLIGELIFLEKYLEPLFGVSNAINFWQGPKGFPQDYVIDDTAVEVKCQLGTTIPKVKITSIDQLSSQLKETYLYVVTLGKTTIDNPNSVNLFDAVNRIESKLCSEKPIQLEVFYDLLLEVGYQKNILYKNFNYILSNDIMYKVFNDFPRLTRDNLTQGILEVSYFIDLNCCKKFEKKPNWMEV
ncbi:MAG: PD-(D/E)XK motif protein [Candidatus Delongbacteria bacterium]|nr:PD-(D/E)XK motif protein [Candidatus Delongbacteria bacterium]MBN2836635.1 PD-(D/E)XK motif protein [Candidatus Delongbacteria bacterium]